jgi:hypothetical protein
MRAGLTAEARYDGFAHPAPGNFALKSRPKDTCYKLVMPLAEVPLPDRAFPLDAR